jgi:hypothetical protein
MGRSECHATICEHNNLIVQYARVCLCSKLSEASLCIYLYVHFDFALNFNSCLYQQRTVIVYMSLGGVP